MNSRHVYTVVNHNLLHFKKIKIFLDNKQYYVIKFITYEKRSTFCAQIKQNYSILFDQLEFFDSNENSLSRCFCCCCCLGFAFCLCSLLGIVIRLLLTMYRIVCFYQYFVLLSFFVVNIQYPVDNLNRAPLSNQSVL